MLGEDISNIDEEEGIRLIEGVFIYPAKAGLGMRYPVDILGVKRVERMGKHYARVSQGGEPVWYIRRL